MKQRNLWPFALFTIPFAAVFVGVAMVSIAIAYPDDVVVDQYYKEGMAINERIADGEKAVELAIGAKILLDSSRIKADISGSVDSLHKLNFHHVTDENLDVSLGLVKQGNYFVALEDSDIQARLAEPGVWYVDLVGVEQDWRLSKRLQTPVDQITLGVASE